MTTDPHLAAQRIDTLLQQVSTGVDADTRDRVEELVRALMELYGAGLERIAAIAGEADGSVLARLSADELVSSLLILHGLHPRSLEARVGAAVERLRRAVGTSLRLDVVTASEDEVAVAIGGRDLGCATASVVESIERAIRDAAPEVRRVDVRTDLAAEPPLLQIMRAAPGGLQPVAEPR
jgi:hypothetical protein